MLDESIASPPSTKPSRAAPPPLQATSQSKPSLYSTRIQSVVDLAMSSSGVSSTDNTTTKTTATSSKQFTKTTVAADGTNAVSKHQPLISSSTDRRRQRQVQHIRSKTMTGSNQSSGSVQSLTWVLGICIILCAIVNLIHVERIPLTDSSTGTIGIHLEYFKQGMNRKEQNDYHNDENEKPHHDTLDCARFGGPSIEVAQEMVYWKDIPSDQSYISPFKAKSQDEGKELYMTFEPDGGGWNNIRMAMETVLALAVATGRTLVLPAEQRMYLLQKNKDKQKTEFSFMDFFPMKELSRENAALKMITMEEFLTKHALTGQMRNKTTNVISFPPDNNRTNWNGQDVKQLKEWLREVTLTPLWDPDSCLASFPESGKHDDSLALKEMHQQLVQQGLAKRPSKTLDHPLPVDSSSVERMTEMLAGRKELCLYDTEMQEAPVLHFMCYHKMHVRMLTHFYTFLYFESYEEDLWMKRFIRDHVRYIDEIQCAAARVVEAMRKYVRTKEPHNTNGDFISFHIRRGDFQFKSTRVEAMEIYNNVKHIIKDGSILFIATDERNKSFFDPLKKKYDIKFLDDFVNVLSDVNHNYFGMIDQVAASRGKVFFGCWFSTFTGYIMRLRGYHSVKDKAPGYEDGLLPNTYYYATKDHQLAMHKYTPIQQGFFTREFPTSWRQIDFGVE